MRTINSCGIGRTRLLIVAACFLLVACGATSEPTSESVSSSNSTSSPLTVSSTTSGIDTTTTGAPTSTVESTAVATPPAPSIPDDAPVLGIDDPILLPPGDPMDLDLSGAAPCRVLTGTASLGNCGVVDANGGGKLVWFTSDQDSPDPPAVSVNRLERDSLIETLELPQGYAAEFGLGYAQTANLDGQAGDELVVGVRNNGSGSLLYLSIIGAQGTVVADIALDHGQAKVTADGLELWIAQFGPDDANCCPSSFEHDRADFDGSNYRLVSLGSVPAAEVPEGQFP